MSDDSRRGFIAALATTVVTGCMGTSSQEAETVSTETATATPEYCDHQYESDAEEVSYAYENAYEQVSGTMSLIGNPEVAEQSRNSVFTGDEALYLLYCDDGPCENSFYDAIETFRDVQSAAQIARTEFNTVETMATACNIELADYVTTAASNGADRASHLIAAAEAFEQSAQNQIDQGNETFQSGEDFETGMDEYEAAQDTEVPDASTVDNRLTVYSGENPQE